MSREIIAIMCEREGINDKNGWAEVPRVLDFRVVRFNFLSLVTLCAKLR
jgi:hypothetical protein